MRDLAVLFFVVLLVYLSQCLCWAPGEAVAFSLETEEKKGRRKAGFSLRAFNLTAYWCNPLPFLQPVMAVYWPPFHPEPEALLVELDHGASSTTQWEDLCLSRSGAKLLCDDVVVFQGGPDQLKSHQEFLQRLKFAKAKERKKIIEKWLQKATDASAAQSRLKLFRDKSAWLEVAANMEFFLLFVMVPLAFFRFGSRALWPSVAALLMTALFIAWQFWRVHKTFFPSDNEARWKALLSTLLSPIYAIRAMDALAKELMSGFHPVAVACVVCTRKDIEALAGELLRKVRYGTHGESWYSQQLQTSLAIMLEKTGVSASQLLVAPEREDGCLLYCPRCRAQYTKVRESCSDCGYEHLAEFQPAPGAAVV